MKRGIGWLAGLLVATAGIASGAPLYVADTGDNLNDGLSWETAKLTIQGALAVAGSPIYVSNGTYSAVSVTRSVEIQGVNGYSNTFIDGGNVKTAVFIKVSSGNPVVLSGFTIQNGLAPRGGGVYVDGTVNVTINDCRIMNNVATSTERAGAGVFKYPSGNALILTNCVIVSNRATASSGYGGGVFSYYAKLYIYNCQILSNMAAAGGGIAAGGPSSIQSFHCRATRIAFNTVSAGGGGVYSECGPEATASVLEDCRIEYNSSVTAGGGIKQRSTSSYPGHLVLSNCQIRGNTTSGYGGGFDAQGGLRLSGCLIAENLSSSLGGGVCIYLNATNTMLFENVTITSNRSTGGTSYCGGFASYSGVTNVSLVNTIIYGNTDPGVDSGRTNVYIGSPASVTFTNCCVAPLTQVLGENNTAEDPLYVNLDAGDYRLQAGSPCVNTGTNQDWMSTAVDLDGHARLDRFSGQVDMGAFEHVPAGVLMKLR